MMGLQRGLQANRLDHLLSPPQFKEGSWAPLAIILDDQQRPTTP
jgi:hypothetical protein